MSWLAWALVIFLTALAVIGGPAWWMGRRERIPLVRLADPAPLPYEPEMIDPLAGCECGCGDALPRAGLLPLDHLPETGPSGPWLEPEPFDLPDALAAALGYSGTTDGTFSDWYGPFPVDTGPLLHLSEQAAARIALERDIEAMCAEAEAKIPPRWRS